MSDIFFSAPLFIVDFTVRWAFSTWWPPDSKFIPSYSNKRPVNVFHWIKLDHMTPLSQCMWLGVLDYMDWLNLGHMVLLYS